MVHVVLDGLGDLLRERTEMPVPVVAVDLLDSDDPRSRRAGEALWAKSVQRWRDAAVPLRARRRGGPR